MTGLGVSPEGQAAPATPGRRRCVFTVSVSASASQIRLSQKKGGLRAALARILWVGCSGVQRTAPALRLHEHRGHAQTDRNADRNGEKRYPHLPTSEIRLSHPGRARKATPEFRRGSGCKIIFCPSSKGGRRRPVRPYLRGLAETPTGSASGECRRREGLCAGAQEAPPDLAGRYFATAAW